MLRLEVVLPVVVCLIADAAFAVAPRPFRAAEIAWQIVREDLRYSWESFGGEIPADGSSDALYGVGLRFERGMAGDFWDLHAALSAAYAGQEWGARWIALRPGIGGRLRIPNSVRTPVKWFVGGGATAGLVHRTGSGFSLSECVRRRAFTASSAYWRRPLRISIPVLLCASSSFLRG